MVVNILLQCKFVSQLILCGDHFCEKLFKVTDTLRLTSKATALSMSIYLSIKRVNDPTAKV